MPKALHLADGDLVCQHGSRDKIHPAVLAIENIVGALDRYRCSETRIRAGKLLLVLGDLVALLIAFTSGVVFTLAVPEAPLIDRLALLTTEEGWVRGAGFGLVTLAMVLWFMGGVNHYTNRRPLWDELYELLLALGVGFVLDAALSVLTRNPLTRESLLATWGLAFVLMPCLRILLKFALLKLGWLYQPYVLVGSGPQVLDTIRALESEMLMGFRPVAVLSTERPAQAGFQASSCNYSGGHVPVFTLTQHLEDFISTPGHLRVVFVLAERDNSRLKAVAQRVALRRDDVYLVPAVAGLPVYGMEMYNFFSHEVLLLRARNNLNRRAVRALKRLFDIVASAFLLLLVAPLLAFVALRIRSESGGEVLFTQQRVGYDGKNFSIFKFRSMVPDADRVLEEWKTANPGLWAEYVASNFKLAADPRVTKVGRWIRRTSIDELPQLINVLRGDMSLVGPRPLLPRELEHYGADIDVYRNVRPGITGLWQVSGRSNTSFAHRVAMDRWYIRNWALWLDLVILIKTIRVVFAAEGAK